MLLMSDIIDEYHENIRHKSSPVTFPMDQSDIATLDSLMEYVINSNNEALVQQYGLRPSVGIAAPQINILKQLCVVALEEEDGSFTKFEFINPKIIRHSTRRSYLPNGEGCLSVNRTVEGIVPRYETIVVKTFTRDGAPIELSFEGYLSIVVQHEIDHLNGVLFMDHINPAHPLTPPPNSKPITFSDDDE